MYFVTWHKSEFFINRNQQKKGFFHYFIFLFFLERKFWFLLHHILHSRSGFNEGDRHQKKLLCFIFLKKCRKMKSFVIKSEYKIFQNISNWFWFEFNFIFCLRNNSMCKYSSNLFVKSIFHTPSNILLNDIIIHHKCFNRQIPGNWKFHSI